jgi:hypothetical protein
MLLQSKVQFRVGGRETGEERSDKGGSGRKRGNWKGELEGEG